MIAQDRRAVLTMLILSAIGLSSRKARSQLVAPPSGPEPRVETARDFVAKIYAAYRGPRPKGVVLASQPRLLAVFEPELARAMARDHKDAASRGEAGVLDWDPFIDARDIGLTDLDIKTDDITSAKARAVVRLVNLSRDTTITIDLIRLKQGWRVFDIRWANFKTLRQLFQLH